MQKILIFFVSLLVINCSHSIQNDKPIPENQNLGDKPEPAPPVDRKVTSYRFALISDLNGSYGSTSYNSEISTAVKHISNSETKIDFVLSTGDMVAGQKSNLDYAAMWRAFHKAVTKPLHQNQVPLMPSPGNHDAYKTRKVERKHYSDTWLAQAPLSIAKNIKLVSGVEQNFPFQYAFTVGEALFVALDNTTAQPWQSSTLAWLEDVLEKNQAAKLKFIYGHIPLLPFAFKKEREYVARGSVSFLDKVESLFEKHKVDAFFSGHSHVYYPGRRDAHTEYISVPLLGSGSRYLITKHSTSRSQRGFLVVEYDSDGNWELVHYRSKDLSVVSDSQFPKYLDMPSSNSSLCKACNEFPQSHFLDASRRIIYRRHDL